MTVSLGYGSPKHTEQVTASHNYEFADLYIPKPVGRNKQTTVDYCNCSFRHRMFYLILSTAIRSGEYQSTQAVVSDRRIYSYNCNVHYYNRIPVSENIQTIL